jgi:hypothetical protein
MNKYKFWGIVAAAGVLLTVFGAWRKLVHYPHADEFLTIGLALFAISQSVYWYLKFLSLQNKKDQ